VVAGEKGHLAVNNFSPRPLRIFSPISAF